MNGKRSDSIPKVAHIVVDSWTLGGTQRNTLVTMAGLRPRGFDVELICGSGEALIDQSKREGIPVRVVRHFTQSFHPFKDVLAFWELYRLARRHRYTIVHTHSTKAGFLGRFAGWLAGVPLIIHTVHGIPYHTTRGLPQTSQPFWRNVLGWGGRAAFRVYLWLERLTTLITDKLVCVGQLVEQEVLDLGFAPEKKLTTIYSGIEFNTLTPKRSRQEMVAELNVAGRWPIIGSVGRLTRQKSQHYLVEAVTRLRGKFPEVLLVVVGDGYLKPMIERYVEENGLERHVMLLGNRDDVADLLPLFDVYAVSSLWEGVGRALTEAMYVGLPVVASAVNGVPELVAHEVTGLLVPPRDVAGLALAMERLARDRDLAARLGRNAAARVAQLMSAERMVADTDRLYRELTRDRNLKFEEGWI